MSPSLRVDGGQAPGIIYISYDGMLEPLGQSQVIAYLEKLAPGRRIHLISFEKPSDWLDEARQQAMHERLAKVGIGWHPLGYHKAPSVPATAYDVVFGIMSAIRLARRHRLEVVHARSYVSALIGLAVKRATGAKLLFDMRGFWADERVDGGLWPAGGRLYRAAKALERKLLLAADHALAVSPSSTAVDRLSLYLMPLQIVVLSRVPYVFATRYLAVSLVVTYCFAIQFVWLNFATHAKYWLPYQVYPVFS